MKPFKKNIDGDLSVGKLIGMLIFVVVAMALLPTVVDAVDSGVENTTGTAAALIPLVTIFYVIGVLVAVIGFAIHETGGITRRP